MPNQPDLSKQPMPDALAAAPENPLAHVAPLQPEKSLLAKGLSRAVEIAQDPNVRRVVGRVGHSALEHAGIIEPGKDGVPTINEGAVYAAAEHPGEVAKRIAIPTAITLGQELLKPRAGEA